jgi:hypothetical protein
MEPNDAQRRIYYDHNRAQKEYNSLLAQIEELQRIIESEDAISESNNEFQDEISEPDDEPTTEHEMICHHRLGRFEKLLRRKDCYFYETEFSRDHGISGLTYSERETVLRACFQLRSGLMRKKLFRPSRFDVSIYRIVPSIISYSKYVTTEEEHSLALEEAEAIFHKGIKSCPHDPYIAALCYFHLAVLLQHKGRSRSDEIPMLLRSALAMSFRFPDAPSLKPCKCIPVRAARKLGEFYSGDENHLEKGITESLEILHQTIMEETAQRRGSCASFQPLGLPCRCYFVTLAGFCSKVLKFFSFCRRYLGFQRDHFLGDQRRELEKSFAEVVEARCALYGEIDTSFANYESTCNYIAIIKGLLLSIKYDSTLYSIVTELDKLLLHADVKRQSLFAKGKNRMDSLLAETMETTQTSSSIDSSNRYGVTYSVTTITGVSNSVFMVP